MVEERKLHLVNLIGMGNLLEAVVAEDVITCEERNRIILRIAEKHGFTGYSLSTLAGYGRSKREVLERAAHRKTSMSQSNSLDESYRWSKSDKTIKQLLKITALISSKLLK